MTQFVVRDMDRGNEREFETKSEAQEAMQDLAAMGADVELETRENGTDADVVDDVETPTGEQEAAQELRQVPNELPERPPVDEDPISWMPEHFIDTIEGVPAINRKGYEVLAQHFGIETRSECQVSPEATEFEFCRHKAVAITEDGNKYEAHGSAHVDRGDDSFLLLEMSDTRARKRAIAQATGVGMVAVSEMQGSSEL